MESQRKEVVVKDNVSSRETGKKKDIWVDERHSLAIVFVEIGAVFVGWAQLTWYLKVSILFQFHLDVRFPEKLS